MRQVATVVSVEPAEPPSERPVPFPHLVPALLGIAALWWAQAVLIPIVFSLVISYALEPLVARLQMWRVPRIVAVPLVLVAVVSCISSGLYALRGQAVDFANRLPEGAHAIAQAVNSQNSSHVGAFTKMQQAVKELEAAAQTNRQPRSADGVPSVRIEEPAVRWNEWLWQGSHDALALGARLFAVVCLVYYLMVAGDMYRRKLMSIVGPSVSSKKLTLKILAEIEQQIARFLIARAIISAVVAVAVWLAFRSLGLAEAGVWAVLAGVLFTIPLVGPAVVIVGAALAALLQTGSPGVALSAAGLCTLIAALEGNVLAPSLMGRVGEMNAVAVFVSLLFWGWLWGPWGLLLAVPITAAAKAVCQRVENLNAYAELLKA